MAKKIFSGSGDETKYTEDEAKTIVVKKLKNFIGNKHGITSLLLYDNDGKWICTTNKMKVDFEKSDPAATLIQEFDVLENKPVK